MIISRMVHFYVLLAGMLCLSGLLGPLCLLNSLYLLTYVRSLPCVRMTVTAFFKLTYMVFYAGYYNWMHKI